MAENKYLTDEQRVYMQTLADRLTEAVRLLDELEHGNEKHRDRAAELFRWLSGTGDNAAFLSRGVLGKLDPITPGNLWEKVYHAQPHYFESDRPKPIQTRPGGIPASRW